MDSGNAATILYLEFLSDKQLYPSFLVSSVGEDRQKEWIDKKRV
jgi:hypothetical protein